ncbi:3-deoxy-D-manno-octulosonic acid transferase [Phenylobacterium sp.]|uniref:3-deoxy-D-manno-octulosonic acid transferase n=1 Tax=Phenylobacterium sp. TaxID=1871053 RepID=UPI0035AE84F0
MTRRPLTLALYAALTTLLEPLAGLALRLRAGRGKEDPARIGERLGRTGRERPPGPLVWLHAVSVGEGVSLLPLVQALRESRPDLSLLVTSGTRTSAELLARRLPTGVIHQYAPVDTPGAVGRFLDHWAPDAGLLVESELWPNLIMAARQRGVRLALLSARMTQASAKGWARVPAAARAILSAFDLVLPQEAATETRLRDLGAQVGPRLNLKQVGEPLPCDPDELARMRSAIGARKVVLAASTHAGEDTTIGRAFEWADLGDALLIVVPRHPERGEAVTEVLEGEGMVVGLRSRGERPAPQMQAYVADTLGELGLFFRLADVVVMGGAFELGIGGHNPLEPARLGKAIITGAHMFNAAETYQEMFIEAAAIEAVDGEHLARHMRGLIDNPMIARRFGEAALSYAERQGYALDEAMARLAPLLPAA